MANSPALKMPLAAAALLALLPSGMARLDGAMPWWQVLAWLVGGAAFAALVAFSWEALVRYFSDWTVAALVVFLVVYYATTRGVFQGKASGDGYFGFLYLPSLVYHRSLDIGPMDPFWAGVLGRERTGHVADACPIGPVAFWLPTYLLGLGLKALVGLVAKLPVETIPGKTPFDFWMAGLGSLAAGILGVALLFRLIARKLGLAAARFGTLAGILATPIVWYFVTQPLYQHACAFLLVTLLVERWDAWREAMDFRRWALLGAIGGAAMLMRFQEGAWLLLPGLDAAAEALAALRHRRWRELLRPVLGVLLLSLCALVVFAPQIALWRWFFGFVRPPQPPGHMRWTDPAIVAALLSTRGGLLPWSPILYLVVPGLALARKRLGGLGWRLALMLAIEVWVNASAWDHWGSWTFGARRFTDATVVFAFGLAGLWSWVDSRPLPSRKWWRAAACASALLAFAFNGLCMELVRTLKLKSSGARAAPASTWIAWAQGPSFIGRVTDRTGYPFVQPAGWIFSILYRAPVTAFEGIVGNYFLERDSRIHAVISNDTLSFADPHEYVVEGIDGPPVGKPGALEVPVGPRVRLLVPLFAAEPLRVRLTGNFHGQERAVAGSWNGVPLVAAPGREVVTFEVPETLVHTRSRANEVVLTVPPGTLGRRIEFQSLGSWWR